MYDSAEKRKVLFLCLVILHLNWQDNFAHREVTK